MSIIKEMEKREKEQKDILKKYGATDIEYYILISNYGYTFKLNGQKYDIRFWANCYGCAINRWMISAPRDDINYDTLNDIESAFNQFSM